MNFRRVEWNFTVTPRLQRGLWHFTSRFSRVFPTFLRVCDFFIVVFDFALVLVAWDGLEVVGYFGDLATFPNPSNVYISVLFSIFHMIVYIFPIILPRSFDISNKNIEMFVTFRHNRGLYGFVWFCSGKWPTLHPPPQPKSRVRLLFDFGNFSVRDG